MIDVQDHKRHKNWKECPREAKLTRWGVLYATMYPDGRIAISRFTHEQLGSPEAYLLLYEEDLHMIGLQPANLAVSKNAYPALERGRHGGRRINGYRLIREFGIHLDETARFPRCVIDYAGTLILDLKDVVPAARKKKKNTYGY